MTVRKLLVGLTIGAITIVGYIGWSPTQADAQDLCDLLGDPYCPAGGGGAITCDQAAPPGATGSCTVSNVQPGDHVTATLVCSNGYSAVLFDGTATSSPFSFTFSVPSDAPLGGCSIQVNGASLPFSVVSGSLARTGTDVGPLLGVGGALVALGVAAALGARRRLRTAEPV